MKATPKTRISCAAGVVTAAFLTLAGQKALTPVNSTPQQIAHPSSGSKPKMVSKTHQPADTPHKASSFAPHPTSRRVFGDPIQPPILGHTAPKSPPPK